MSGPIVIATAVGEHLGISQRPSPSSPSGVLSFTGDGFDLDAYRLRYTAWLKDERRGSTKTAARSRVQDARAREVEIRIGRQEGTICETSEAIDYLS